MCDFKASNIIFILTCFSSLATTVSQDEILSFEYGQHIPGEQVSFIYNGIIPAFKPSYLLNVTTNKEGLQKKFTYLRAEYLNALSSIVVLYDPDKVILTFHVKFPFIETAIGVLGYALPIKSVPAQ